MLVDGQRRRAYSFPTAMPSGGLPSVFDSLMDKFQKGCNAIGMKWNRPRQGTLIDLEEMPLQEKLSGLVLLHYHLTTKPF
jgi:hypothetical protein